METPNKSKPSGRHNPLNDYLFLRVMGEKGDEGQLLGFLNATLGRSDENRLSSVEILEDKTFSPEFLGNKASILDIRARLYDGTMVNIEVQLRNLGNMDKRSLFYWSREYSKGIKEGEDYTILPNVITINIIDFEFLEAENFHTVFHLREDKEKDFVLTGVLEIHFLDMVKWRRLREKDLANEPLHRWLTWFDESSPPELVAEVVKMDNAIRLAEEKQEYVLSDEDAIRAYERRQKMQWDLNSLENSALLKGRTEGHAKGLAEGHAEGEAVGFERANLEIARKMKARGRPLAEIAEYTDLSSELIENL